MPSAAQPPSFKPPSAASFVASKKGRAFATGTGESLSPAGCGPRRKAQCERMGQSARPQLAISQVWMEIELAAMEIDTAAKALKRWPDRRVLGERRGARGRVRRGSAPSSSTCAAATGPSLASTTRSGTKSSNPSSSSRESVQSRLLDATSRGGGDGRN